MLRRDCPRRHDRGNRPEDRVRAGNEQARCNEQLERGSHSASELTHREQRDYREQQPLELETRCEHHERQRERHDRPCIDRGHHASLRLGKAEAAGDAAQKTDGHELRGVEYEGRASETRKRKPLPRRHGAALRGSCARCRTAYCRRLGCGSSGCDLSGNRFFALFHRPPHLPATRALAIPNKRFAIVAKRGSGVGLGGTATFPKHPAASNGANAPRETPAAHPSDKNFRISTVVFRVAEYRRFPDRVYQRKQAWFSGVYSTHPIITVDIRKFWRSNTGDPATGMGSGATM